LRKKKYQTPSVDQMQAYLREAPVRIFDLIRDHGITLTFTELEEGISGSVEAKNERFEIVVNSSLGELHRRYAAAYELSRLLFNRHAVIDHEGPVVSRLFVAPDKKGRTGTDPDAARLAAGLLMPAEGVRGMNGSGKEPQEIAAAYEVTGAAIRGRLRQLYLTPNEPRPEPDASVTGSEPQP
jgi:Zn-dependent peptidase ImmA (M78 family)